MQKIYFIFLLGFLLVTLPTYSQEKKGGILVANDSLKYKEINPLVPAKAAFFSAILPGLGQAYNKKYWKIPVVYGALGGFAYMFAVNNKEYNYYRKNLFAVNDDDSSTTNATPYNSDDLQILKLEYKKYRDFAAIGVGLVYLFNLIDANVDAHLKTFDVSDDLSIEINPWQQLFGTNKGYKTATGLSLKFIF